MALDGEKDQLELLALEFDNWQQYGAVSSELCESELSDSACSEFARSDPEKSLFLGVLAFNRGELEKASAFYEKAFAAEFLREGDGTRFWILQLLTLAQPWTTSSVALPHVKVSAVP